MYEFMMYTLYLEVLNVLLLLGLLTRYIPNYRALHSMTGLGLILFSVVLLIQNAVGLFFHFSGWELDTKMSAIQEWGLQLIETLALLVLIYSAWKE